MGGDDRDAAFDDAEHGAQVVVEATAAAFGAADEDASSRDNVVTMLRIVGPRARSCEHLTGPAIVYLHSATRVHMCEDCASSPATREAIEAHSPRACDSCGDEPPTLWQCQFTVSNVVVTAYVCGQCRDGSQTAVMPDWIA